MSNTLVDGKLDANDTADVNLNDTKSNSLALGNNSKTSTQHHNDHYSDRGKASNYQRKFPPSRGVSDRFMHVDGGRTNSFGRGRSGNRNQFNNLFVRRPPPTSRYEQNSRRSRNMTPNTAWRQNSDSPEKKQSTQSYHNSNKIYRLMSRISSFPDKERQLSAVRSLNDFLHTSEALKIFSANVDDILVKFEDLFYKSGFREVKQELTNCVGYLGSSNTEDVLLFIDWLLPQASSSSVDKNTKVYFLQALIEALKHDSGKKCMRRVITRVMGHMQSLLENAEADLLEPVVHVIVMIARDYSHIFSSHFVNVVDILVGWHIDMTQKDELIDFVSETLVSFRSFWSIDVHFSTTLLLQFIEDLEAYSEDMMAQTSISSLDTESGAEVVAGEILVKMSALLNVFSTVLQGLGDNIAPSSNRISKEFGHKLLRTVIASVQSATKYVQSEMLLIGANRSLSVMVAQLGSHAIPCGDVLLPFVSFQAVTGHYPDAKFLVSFFTVVQKVVLAFNTQLPIAFVSEVFSPESLMYTQRLSACRTVQAWLMKTYHAVMEVRNIPLLEESYRHILCDLEVAMKTLRPNGQKLCLVPDVVSSTSYSLPEAEAVVIFNLNVLAAIANSKNNLIGMLALSPSVFDLLSDRLVPTDRWTAERHPAVHYGILFSLYGHCSRHGHFMSSSSLLSSLTAVTVATINRTTSKNFSSILRVLASVVGHSKASFDVQCLCLKWVYEIVSGLRSSPHVLVIDCFLDIIRAVIGVGYYGEGQVIEGAARCLLAVFRLDTGFPFDVTRRCFELCTYRLTDARKTVCGLFFSLLAVLQLEDAVASNGTLFEASSRRLKDPPCGLQGAWLMRHNCLRASNQSLCDGHNFRYVMAYMLKNSQPSKFGGFSWLRAMFSRRHRSVTEMQKVRGDVCVSDLDPTEAVMWFYATFEAANFTVLSRLRTPFGKPQDTFLCIESALKGFAAEAMSAPETDSVVKLHKWETAEECGRLQRVCVLLQFLEHLEKLLYNAYEGCSIAMAAPPKNVGTFFRTNRNTCLEWLSRIRLSALSVAEHAGRHAVVVRHAYEALTDTGITQGPEFEQVVVCLVRALTALNCFEAVMGVHQWCLQFSPSKFSWIPAAGHKASRRYERAAKEYCVMLSSNSAEDGVGRGQAVDTDVHSLNSPLPTELAGEWSDSIDTSNFEGGDSFSSKSPYLLSFINEEIIDSYMRLNDWQSAIDWQQQVSSMYSKSVSLAIHSSVDLNLVRAMSFFDLGELDNVLTSLDLVPSASFFEDGKSEKARCRSWCPNVEMLFMRQQFLRAVSIIGDQGQSSQRVKAIRMLSEAEKSGQCLLRASAMDWPPLLSPDSLTETAVISALRRQLEEADGQKVALPLSGKLKYDDQDVSVYLGALRYTNLQFRLASREGRSELVSVLSNLHIATARLARKQTNYALAEKLLILQVNNLSLPAEDRPLNAMIRTEGAQKLLPTLDRLEKIWDTSKMLEVLRVEREGAKLLHALGQPLNAVRVLSNGVCRCLTSGEATCRPTARSDEKCREVCARSLTTLAKWLQQDSKLISRLVSITGQLHVEGPCEDSVRMASLGVHDLLSIEAKGLFLDRFPGWNDPMSSGGIPDGEKVVGRFLHLATTQGICSSKSWFTLAGWCYKWGRKSLDSASNGSVELLDGEKTSALAILPQGVDAEETERILTVLGQVHGVLSTEEDISEGDQDEYDDGVETARRQLHSASKILSHSTDGCVDKLLAIWHSVLRRVYHLYQLSAQAYFTYLNFSGDFSDFKNRDECGDGNIVATLRLLRLLVKHAWELQDVLETGLANTPTAPWKDIIPQLFARLNHPEGYVRRSVSDLLCRVAQDSPNLIVYPAVVGSTCGSVNGKASSTDSYFLNTCLRQGGVEDEDEAAEAGTLDDISSSTFQSCLAAVVDTLSQHNQRMISEVQSVVHEFRRITLLWEELWLGTLTQQHSDVQRRLAQLETEICKVQANSSLSHNDKLCLIREKHRVLLLPTLHTMEMLHAITSRLAETPHEAWFQATYQKLICSALDRLRNPSNPCHPHASWHLFKQVYISLQQRASKRSSLLLKMDEISPKLTALTNSVIPMPGVGKSGEVVTIAKVHNVVQILPTKTKPKKLVFIGSDGKKYPYLFKGTEDLHLDERIMQFLSIVNSMFASESRHHGQSRKYHARHYSVTPLGQRSGLIQLVDGATPLFSLYKKWQLREAYAQAVKPGLPHTQANSGTVPTAVPRAGEVFLSKLKSVFREQGLEPTDKRKDWPTPLLHTVLLSLIEDTPSNLLSKEMWCGSVSAADWWNTLQAYARSTAVMSMIGYIIGLGDRHLDNILVDLVTGEVVHIDYNVCFEKGKTLSVPERVPFRMTQNIVTALGITGVEGTFRTSCSHVLQTMRKGKETLLTLLEAFVYDPLVDWTTGSERGCTGFFYGGETSACTEKVALLSRKEMEREIAVSLFAIRCAEMTSFWNRNRKEMSSSLSDLQRVVEAYVETAECRDSAQRATASLTELKTLINCALGNPEHSLYSLSDRHTDHAVLKATKADALLAVEEKMRELCMHRQQHKNSLEAMLELPFRRLCDEIRMLPDIGPSCFSTATDFLHKTGQVMKINECERAEEELITTHQQLMDVLLSSVDSLRPYSNVVSQLGVAFATTSRMYCFLDYLEDLSGNFCAAKCEEVISRFQEHYGANMPPMNCPQFLVSTESHISNVLAETNARLVKMMERGHWADVTSLVASCEVSIQREEASLAAFIHDTGPSGERSLVGCAVNALCLLAKRYLQMESTSLFAADRLVDLTSRDGDWFLEELTSISGNVNYFLSLLDSNTSLRQCKWFQALYSGLRATGSIFLSVQDLHVNFRSIIVPEALKLIQSQESSMLGVLSCLENLAMDSNLSFDAMEEQVEVLCGNAITGVPGDVGPLHAEVEKLQASFNRIVHGSPDPSATDRSDLSPGQMLLMGFDGLFTCFDTEIDHLMSGIVSLDFPDSWAKVDAIREARALQHVNPRSGDARRPLALGFFLKRLQTMLDFFRMATQLAAAVQGLDGGAVFDDDQMARPVKKFISDYVCKHVIGIPSQLLGRMLCHLIGWLGLNVDSEIALRDVGAQVKVSLAELCRKATDLIQRGDAHLQRQNMTNLSAMLSLIDADWRKLDIARRIKLGVSLLKETCARWGNLLTTFHWIHDGMFSSSLSSFGSCGVRAAPGQLISPSRADVLEDMKKVLRALSSQESQLSSALANCCDLEHDVCQRLRWAAGANSSARETYSAFEEACSQRVKLVQECLQVSGRLLRLQDGLVRFEACRTRTKQSAAMDTSFVALLNKCHESCVVLESTQVSVSDWELRLLDVQPLKGGQKTDWQWMEVAAVKVGQSVDSTAGAIDSLMSKLSTAREDILASITSTRAAFAGHRDLMSNVLPILSTVAKMEIGESSDGSNGGHLQAYLECYMSFSEAISAVLELSLTGEDFISVLPDVVGNLKDLILQIPTIYDGLIGLARPLLSAEVGRGEDRVLPDTLAVVKKRGDVAGPQRRKSDTADVFQATLAGGQNKEPCMPRKERPSRDPKTGKALQGRNRYAVGVWKQVKAKLDGRDPDSSRRLRVQDQVSAVIKEATDLDNLALLYEGWTAWV